MSFKAGKALNEYFLGNRKDISLLVKAKTFIDEATEGDQDTSHFNVFYNRARIYNELAINNRMSSLLPASEVEALQSLHVSRALVDKNFQEANLLLEYKASASIYNLKGEAFYDKRLYDSSYVYFNTVKEIKGIVNLLGDPLFLKKEAESQGLDYKIVLSSMHLGTLDQDAALLQGLYDNGFKESGMYEALYLLHQGQDKAKALKYLEEGRVSHPRDLRLLERYINTRLQAGENHSDLQDTIRKALTKDYSNPTLHLVLANLLNETFMNLYEGDAGASAKAIFDEAKNEYVYVLRVNENLFEANYNLASMYFNHAVWMIKKKELVNDRAIQDFDYCMERSLHFFEKCYDLNKRHIPTLISIKDIHQYKGDIYAQQKIEAMLSDLGYTEK